MSDVENTAAVTSGLEAAASDVLMDGVYYVIRLTETDSVCVVPGDQLCCHGDQGLVIGAQCEVEGSPAVGGGGGEIQQAIIIGVGSESAINVLESCLKNQPLDADSADSPPADTATSDISTISGVEVSPVPQPREAPRGAVGGQGMKGAWSSELASLLSPAKPSKVTEKQILKAPTKRPAVAMGIRTSKKKRIEEKSPLVSRATGGVTVVPARPQETPVTSRLCREIDPPPHPSQEKTDTLSLVLHEVRELKRCYSTLAGSLLIMRRGQEDIKNRLTEIGLSIVTNSSDPLMLTSDPSPTPAKLTSLTSLSHDSSTAAIDVLDHADIVKGDPNHPHTLQGIDLSATFPEFDPEYLIVSRGKSCSRRNFAVNLVRYLFTSEEMAQSNCSGTRGKSRLEQERLAIVRRATLTLWPVEDRLEERTEWAKCIYSIDEACRRLNRPKVHTKRKTTGEEGEGESFTAQL